MKVRHPDDVLSGTPQRSRPRQPLGEDPAEQELSQQEPGQQEAPLHTHREEESRPPWTPDPGE